MDNLTDAELKRIAEQHRRYFAEERARDAVRLAEYQRDCLASWEGRK